ncbi:tunicamycin resistance ATP-binding TmrB [Bacillus haynesii]|uniref:tunicamycin resistance ATP-binding TmrB n=1 Tax=Bacillus haynesii TaxID=1925021 RepID=UPI00227EB417|nr:tunicamycin resistance ATP-binding TmrB [Bacillus haynesii]MCY7815682.1 tunicamycin resistance ATP-binding TmrB [Bacillus haynesii]MCY8225303.1 tunicamycin resistance ATP-binding TmrB [Bacillus haynesii]MCY8243022.1 tunicamycin resistance ATP-binding TmrB [Bacillus haynesii]MCY8567792.1 tunicamycin resistance ATP-binding TmrB [Bacillus haynesii]MCY8661596.1 tunicamycin resistance ATP-binding TmrB [Bacillus haynesii]
MIIWINGAFGSGKTQTAFELHRRLKKSYVYDPEKMGFAMRSMVPSEIAEDDFQNYALWREFNYSLLSCLSDTYSGILIVPMTIVNPGYFEEIIGRLRQDDRTVYHFTLMASKDILHKRLRTRAEGKNSWAAKQIDRCIEGLSDKTFEEHINTDHMSIQNVAETIAAKTSLAIDPDTRGSIKRFTDRLLVKLNHIRLK